MANRERGEVTFQVESESYTLRLDLNALCEVEAVMSTDARAITWQQALQMAQRNSLSAIRAILWAALQPHHPALSLEDVGLLIQKMGGIPGIAKTLADAVKNALPEGGKSARPPKARSGGTGPSSSSEPAASGSSAKRSGD